jgi:hypothetical protein
VTCLVEHLSLLGSRKLNAYMDTLASRCCCVAWLPDNRGRIVTWILSPLKCCCVHVSCMATNGGKVECFHCDSPML